MAPTTTSSSADKGLVSIRKLLNARVFPLQAATVSAVVFFSNMAIYLSLRSKIPPEQLSDVRHATYFIVLLSSFGVTLVLAICMFVAAFIDKHITRELMRIANWAGERCRNGEGRGMPTHTRVKEVSDTAFTFESLYDEVLRRVNELRKMIETTNHDVGNKLSGICSTAQFLRDRSDYSRTVAAEETLAAADDIKHLVDTYARMTRNYCNIRGATPEDVRLCELVDNCLDRLEADAARQDVKLDNQVPPLSAIAVAHPAMLECVITNLVGNAIKYTPRGGSAKLSVMADASGVTIEVADTGVGIREEEKLRVRERGYRSNDVRHIPGSGKGLASVEEVASFYGGSMQIADNRPKGTVITVKLPVKVR